MTSFFEDKPTPKKPGKGKINSYVFKGFTPTQEYYANEMYKKYGKVVLTDKANNRTYYGTKKPDGTWDINEFEVLTGKQGNKKRQEIGGLSLAELEANPEQKITPIGVFPLTYQKNIYGFPGYFMEGSTKDTRKTVIAYHDTYVAPNDTKRSTYYNNNNPYDNYASYGCVNCERPSLENLIKFVGKSGMTAIIDSRLSPSEISNWMYKNTPKSYIQYKEKPNQINPKLPTKKPISTDSSKKMPVSKPQVPASQQVPVTRQMPASQQAPVSAPVARQKANPYSVVDYLSSRGQQYSKAYRSRLAEKLGIENYDYSANKNIELLKKLQTLEEIPEARAGSRVPNNPGFNALPEEVQQKIIDNMAAGGKMPAEYARARFAAAGNEHLLKDYGYAAYGGMINAMAAGGKMPQAYAEARFKAAGNADMLSEYGYEQAMYGADIEPFVYNGYNDTRGNWKDPGLKKQWAAQTGMTAQEGLEYCYQCGGMVKAQDATTIRAATNPGLINKLCGQALVKDENRDVVKEKSSGMSAAAAANQNLKSYYQDWKMMGQPFEYYGIMDADRTARRAYGPARDSLMTARPELFQGEFYDEATGKAKVGPEDKYNMAYKIYNLAMNNPKNQYAKRYLQQFGRNPKELSIEQVATDLNTFGWQPAAAWWTSGGMQDMNRYVPKKEYGGDIMPMYEMDIPEAKSGIYIKPSKRGTFTAAAKKRGMGVQEFAGKVMANKEDYSSAMVKKANFARNAAKWKKGQAYQSIAPDTPGGLPMPGPEDRANLIDLGIVMPPQPRLYNTPGFDERPPLEQADPAVPMTAGERAASIGLGPDRWMHSEPWEKEAQKKYDSSRKVQRNYDTDLLKVTPGEEYQNWYKKKWGNIPYEKNAGAWLLGGLAFASRFLREDTPRYYNRPEDEEYYNPYPSGIRGSQAISQSGGTYISGTGIKMAKAGQMIKRKDGSYSRRGLWDNIRANRGSGRKPTKEMLRQERKIKAKEAEAGMDITGLYYPRGGEIMNVGTPEMPIARMGGNIRKNYGASEYEQGGELTLYDDRTGAQPISDNPVSEGPMVEFKGPRHQDGGMVIDWQGTPVEVEGQETGFKDKEGNFQVWGNLMNPLTGRMFKNDGKEIAKQENKYTKKYVDAINKIALLDFDNPYENLTAQSYMAKAKGAEEKLQNLDALKTYFTELQQGKLALADELGVEAMDLDGIQEPIDRQRGNTAQAYKSIGGRKGKTRPPEDPVEETPPGDIPPTGGGDGGGESPKFICAPEGVRQINPASLPAYSMGIGVYDTYEAAAAACAANKKPKTKGGPPDYNISYTPPPDLTSNVQPFDWSNVYPEIYALATNQVEPVFMQKFRPRLKMPFQYSFQDQLNANTASYRSMLPYVRNNPSMQAALAAQKYSADSGVLSNEFRVNQQEAAGVYNENLDRINQANMVNIQMADTQAVRQAQARANTRKRAFDALQSISQKRLLHQAAMNELAVLENLYAYRYGKDYKINYQGRPIDLQNWDLTPMGTDERGNATLQLTQKEKNKNTAQKGGSLGNIIKGYKRRYT